MVDLFTIGDCSQISCKFKILIFNMLGGIVMYINKQNLGESETVKVPEKSVSLYSITDWPAHFSKM